MIRRGTDRTFGILRAGTGITGLVVVLLLLLLAAILVQPAAAGTEPRSAEESSRIMLRLAPGVRSIANSVDLSALGLEQTRVFPQTGTRVLELSGDRSSPEKVQAALAALSESPDVVWVEEDKVRTLAKVPDDELYYRQWGLVRVGMEDVWDETQGSDEIVVAVLDSGLHRDIPDLAGRIVSPYSVLNRSSAWPAWDDVIGHGTACASIIAAQGDNKTGMAGVAWEVKIMPVHLCDEDYYFVSDEIEGIYYAVEHGADVINVSAGSFERDAAEEEAIAYAISKGVAVVGAAGNSGQGSGIFYPGALPGVLAVGASDKNDKRATFSSTGPELDVVAPGVDIVCWTSNEDEYFLAAGDGTSFAAPLVSGLVALMLSENPSLSVTQIHDMVTDTAKDLGTAGHDSLTGHGLVDAQAAFQRAVGSAPTTTTSTTSTTVPVTSTTSTTVPQTTTTTISSDFPDVPAGHYYADAIARVKKAGVFDGYENGTFGPDDPITRQQFVKVLLRAMEQEPTEQMVTDFVDVGTSTSGLYPDHYIALGQSLGIVQGVTLNPPRFKPYSPVLRLQAISMVVRGADRLFPGTLDNPPSGLLPPFGLTSSSHDPALARASFNGLLDGLKGMSSSWDPWHFASRAEVAALLAEVLDIGEDG